MTILKRRECKYKVILGHLENQAKFKTGFRGRVFWGSPRCNRGTRCCVSVTGDGGREAYRSRRRGGARYRDTRVWAQSTRLEEASRVGLVSVPH
jgi:hypothetical protein